MLNAATLMVRRELLLAQRRRADVLVPLAFFMVVAALFPLGISPEPALLRTVAPGVLWVAALLASLLGLPRLFADDLADGSLDHMLLAPQPLEILVLAKAGAHWLTAGLPLVLLAPLLALQYGLERDAMLALVMGLLLGTPILSLLGAVGAALALGARGGSVLVALILLPLYVPMLVLGTTAVTAVSGGLDPAAHFLLLGGLLAGTLALSPWAAASALRIATD